MQRRPIHPPHVQRPPVASGSRPRIETIEQPQLGPTTDPGRTGQPSQYFLSPGSNAGRTATYVSESVVDRGEPPFWGSGPGPSLDRDTDMSDGACLSAVGQSMGCNDKLFSLKLYQ